MNEELELIPEEAVDGFVIDSDEKADWAIRTIKEAEAERDRLIEICDAYIETYKGKKIALISETEAKTYFLRTSLQEYFKTVQAKETKTQYSYKLLSGSLVKAKPKYVYNRNDEALLAWLEENQHEEFIKVATSVAWADLKKKLAPLDGGLVVTTEGELVDGITAELVDGDFNIK